jgi:hypothetical protein
VSLCGLTSDEGWLLVFVIAPIEKTSGSKNTELAVKMPNFLVPIQQLTALFVGSKCASYAEKPKVFFFLDFDAGKKADGPAVRYKIVTLNIFVSTCTFYSDSSRDTKRHMQ